MLVQSRTAPPISSNPAVIALARCSLTSGEWMAAPLTAARRSEDSAPAEPLSFLPWPRGPLLLTCGSAPLLVDLLGWPAPGCFGKRHLSPAPTVDFATPIRRAAS
jgi:hypothetical protein